MLTVQETGRHGVWSALSALFNSGSRTSVGTGTKGDKDRRTEESKTRSVSRPEARVPYDFSRTQGPGRVL